MADNDGQGGDGEQDFEARVAAGVAEQVAGLRKNRDEVLREAKELKKRLAVFEGVDPEEARALKAEKDENERKRAAAEGNFKAQEAQLVERHKAELAQRETRIVKLTATLEKELKEAKLTAAVARAEGIPEFLLPHLLDKVRIRERDDRFEAYIPDPANPEVARIKDGQGTEMGFDDLVAEMKQHPVFAHAFKGHGGGGSGAPAGVGGGGGAGSPKVIDRTDTRAVSQNIERIAKGEVVVR